MKMVKSLLLGTAAGLVAMSGAQAADLPVKAKPVQYVKICSLYGAGFYYIPGTDMCLKIGGWARVYDTWGANGNNTNGALGTANVNTRATENAAFRVRGYITADARNQTEYGTLRSYLAVGYSAGGANGGVAGGVASSNGTGASGVSSFDPAGVAPGFNANRAFIQFAGFTFGVTQSFYDFYSQPATSFFGGVINPASDTGDGGHFVAAAYTAQFGNGLSATLSAEGERSIPVIDQQSGLNSTYPLSVNPASSAIGTQWPDIVANLRVDQAWGSAQIMGAIHDASAQYYSGVIGSGATTLSGHPDNAIGWAIGAGLKLNAPMIGQGDYLQMQVNYSEGASGYVDASANNMVSEYSGGGSQGFGIISDSVYGGSTLANTTSIQLTTMWGVNAAYEHFWSPKWQTSVYGAYIATSYNGQANAMLCSMEASYVSGAGAGAGSAAVAGVSCDNNWSYWNVGTRTQFNIDSSTYLGLDVVYSNLNTALSGMTAVAASGTQPAVARTLADQSAWTVQFRVHRNFYP